MEKWCPRQTCYRTEGVEVDRNRIQDSAVSLANRVREANTSSGTFSAFALLHGGQYFGHFKPLKCLQWMNLNKPIHRYF